MTKSKDELLQAGMDALHKRYHKELEDIKQAINLTKTTLGEQITWNEFELVTEVVKKLDKQGLPATEYLASYATDHLRSSGRATKDWFSGTLSSNPPRTDDSKTNASKTYYDGHKRPHNDETAALADDASRSPAEIDVDRIGYSTEFRRLGGVTQVIPPQQDHLIHDRLTHSMKVAHVAAALARRVLIVAHSKSDAKRLQGFDLDLADSCVHPDYCYAAGLAHDIGHPPYGHAGEQALQSLLGSKKPKKGDPRPPEPTELPRSFEGNAQSMRIVANLCFRKEDQYQGLNLTYRSLAALAKYPWKQGENPDIKKLDKKWSFYPEEAHILDWLIEHHFIEVERDPESNRVVNVYRWPEAEIMDWADDIAYAAHDLEDFFRLGLIPLHRIASAIKNADEKIDWKTTEFHLYDEEVAQALRFARHKMELVPVGADGGPAPDLIGPAFKVIKNSLARHFPLTAFDGTRRAQVSVQKFGSAINIYLMRSCWLERVEVNGSARIVFVVDPAARLVAEFFKGLFDFFIIQSSTVATMQRGHAISVETMFKHLEKLAIEWVEQSAKEGPTESRALPARLREYIRTPDKENSGNPREKIRIAVVDYICSLRDEQAAALTSRFKGNRDAFGMTAGWLDT